MKYLTLIAAAAFATLSAGATSAAPVYADSVIDHVKGDCEPVGIGPVNGDGCIISRDDPMATLGAPDDDFYSLGFDGWIHLGFSGGPFSGSSGVSTYEITFDRTVGHDEAVDVYVVLGAVETFAGTIFNTVGAVGTVVYSGAFDSLKLVDVTKTYFPVFPTVASGSFDGFDVDAVGVSQVPLPAAALLLLAGLGGFAALRRKS